MSGSTFSPTAAYVDATGIHAPAFEDVQGYLISQFQAIYGADIVVSSDTQDGQLIGIVALAISDANSMAVAVYQSFSPTTAQGIGLSQVVKINGMARHVPSNSSVDVTIGGTAGTTINNGVVADLSNNLWNLPASVTIPPGGTVLVTAIAQATGDIPALPHTVTTISTPTRGWQTVDNPGAATMGAPVEDDPVLRQRQSQSTAVPALSVLEGVTAAILLLPGVLACKGYENDTNTDLTGSGGLPAHSIGMVVRGGDAQTICDTILRKKTPGAFTAGTTRETSIDVYGIAHDIGFFDPTPVAITVHITLTAKIGYTSAIGSAIQTTVAAYVMGLGSGIDVVWSKLWLPANLCDAVTGAPLQPGATNTYDITALTLNGGTVNVPIALAQVANMLFSDVTITVS